MCSVFITRVKKKSFENERGIQRKSESHNADKAFSETYHVQNDFEGRGLFFAKS